MKKYISKIMLGTSAFIFIYALIQAAIFSSGNSLFDQYHPLNFCIIIGLISTSALFLGLYRIIDLLEQK